MPRTAQPAGSVRTSVFLPAETLAALQDLGPTQSEAIRRAIDRYLYIRDVAQNWVEHIVEAHGDALIAALTEFDASDYKLIVRVLPELVSGYLDDLPMMHPHAHGHGDCAAELKKLNQVARMAILDWVIAQRGQEA